MEVVDIIVQKIQTGIINFTIITILLLVLRKLLLGDKKELLQILVGLDAVFTFAFTICRLS